MQGLKKVVVILIAAFMFAIVGGGVSTVANAAPAEAAVSVSTAAPTVIGGSDGGAVTAEASMSVAKVIGGSGGVAPLYRYTQGPIKYQWDWYWNGYRYMCGVWAYIDYDWYEETFQGKRDGWYRLYYAYC